MWCWSYRNLAPQSCKVLMMDAILFGSNPAHLVSRRPVGHHKRLQLTCWNSFAWKLKKNQIRQYYGHVLHFIIKTAPTMVALRKADLILSWVTLHILYLCNVTISKSGRLAGYCHKCHALDVGEWALDPEVWWSMPDVDNLASRLSTKQQTLW